MSYSGSPTAEKIMSNADSNREEARPAFEDLFQRHWQRLYSVLYRLTGEEVQSFAVLSLSRNNQRAYVVDYGFGDLDLLRIYATHFARNPASGRVMQKAGMTREGCLRQHVLRWDVPQDLVYYGILRDEWLVLRRGRESE